MYFIFGINSFETSKILRNFLYKGKLQIVSYSFQILSKREVFENFDLYQILHSMQAKLVSWYDRGKIHLQDTNCHYTENNFWLPSYLYDWNPYIW